MNTNELIAFINARIYENGNQEITGDTLNQVLVRMTQDLGSIKPVGNLTGYISLASTDDLPPSESTIGYLIDGNLYVWVGEGGDAASGTYQNCGPLRGPEGKGIVSVVQTVVSNVNGGENTIRVTLTDGTEQYFQIRNGKSSAGLYPTSSALEAAIPSPKAGDYAFVGDSFPAEIYVCLTDGEWSDSGEEYDGDSVELTDYAKKSELTELGQEAFGNEFALFNEGKLSAKYVDNSYVVSSDGSFSAYNGWSRTDYINVFPFLKIIVTATKASSYNAFYDKGKNFIKSFSLSIGANYLVIPDGAYYMALSNTTADMKSATFDISDFRFASKSDVEKYDGAQYIKAPVSSPELLSFTAGYVIAPDGTVEAQQTTFAVSAPVTLENAKGVIITTKCGYGYMLYAFYDSNDEFISGFQGASGGYTEITDEEVQIPDGSATIRIGVNNISTNTSLKIVTDFVPSNQPQVDGNTEKINGLNMVEDLVGIPFTMQSQEYIDSQGVITAISNNDYVTSGYVDVTGKSAVVISASGNYSNGLYAFYDENQSLVLMGEKAASGSAYTILQNEHIVVPSSAKYIVVAGRVGRIAPAIAYPNGYKLPGEWIGKKWIAVGDSLTEANQTSTKKYHDYISAETGISVVNMGAGGTGYKRGEDQSKAFYQRVSSIATDADAITIFGSFNDLGSDFDLGSPTDTGTTTICGCINATLDAILSVYMTAGKIPSIGVITPAPWKNRTPASPTSISAQYVDALIECCKLKSIPVLDLWRCSNMHPDDSTFRSLAYSNDGDSGVHPDDNGHKLFAPIIKQFVGKILQ